MKEIMYKINKAYDKFDKVNEVSILILMTIMCFDLLAQVIFRYLFNNPLTWSEELARYIFTWIALLGAAWMGRGHIHIKMTAVTSKLPETAQRVIQIFNSLFCCGICMILISPAMSIFQSQSRLTAITLGVSLGIQYIVAPVGITMLAIQQGIDALYAIFDWEGYTKRYRQKD